MKYLVQFLVIVRTRILQFILSLVLMGRKQVRREENIIGCQTCPKTEYLLFRGSQECNPCAKGAVCEGGIKFMLKKDWWQPGTHLQKKENEECVFPFKYKNVEYSKCVEIDSSKPWCMTSNSTGHIVMNQDPFIDFTNVLS